MPFHYLLSQHCIPCCFVPIDLTVFKWSWVGFLSGTQIFFLSHTHVTLINSSFTFVSIVSKISPYHNCQTICWLWTQEKSTRRKRCRNKVKEISLTCWHAVCSGLAYQWFPSCAWGSSASPNSSSLGVLGSFSILSGVQ